VEFVVDKLALGQIFLEYFLSPATFHSTNCYTITIIYHLGLVNSGRSTKWTQPHPTNKNKK
jgi:hypothetical protein